MKIIEVTAIVDGKGYSQSFIQDSVCFNLSNDLTAVFEREIEEISLKEGDYYSGETSIFKLNKMKWINDSLFIFVHELKNKRYPIMKNIIKFEDFEVRYATSAEINFFDQFEKF